jgi:PPOX class probable F420-dependent enzyme
LTDDRAKTKNLRRDDRAVLHVTSTEEWYQYVAADGVVELTPVATDPHDATVDELCEVYEAVVGAPHDNWDEFRQAMVDDRRLVARLRVDHVYGMVRR